MAKATDTGGEPETGLTELLAAQTPERLQALSTALTEAAQESQAILNAVMSPRDGVRVPAANDPFGTMNAFASVGSSFARNPQSLIDANLRLWQNWMELWQGFARGDTAANTDKRFSDPEWSTNPAFDFMRRAYELNASWMLSLIDNAEGVDEAAKRKARFFTRQTVEAMSPTNFFATNPAALRAMLETGGQTLVDGLRNARADLERGKGRLSISQTDPTPFEVGRNLATAPGKVVYRNRLIELIQYSPTQGETHEIPLLIFPPWINKFYILDLREENSMIRWLVDQGLSVFVVSWRSADETTADLTWDDYIREGLLEALDATLAVSGTEQVNSVGYCIGGTLLSSALSWMAKEGETRIASATFFASQSDFREAGDLLVLTDEEARTHIDNVIANNDGIMPGELMGETFNWLRPVDLVWRYVVDNYLLGRQPRPFDLLYWNADQTNIPGPTHRTYLNEMYASNALSEGRFRVFGSPVSMADIEIPVLLQAGREDHICPWRSVYLGARRYGGPTKFVLAGSGHIAGVVNHPASKKYQHWTNDSLPDQPEAWLAEADETAGSWWPTWWAWLKPKSGPLVPALKPEDKGLGDAPGEYVRMRLSDISGGQKPDVKFSPTHPKKSKAKPAAKAVSRKSGATQGKSGSKPSSPSA